MHVCMYGWMDGSMYVCVSLCVCATMYVHIKFYHIPLEKENDNITPTKKSRQLQHDNMKLKILNYI